ncbi:hypothetical protein G6F45_012154 [Rhizopus arrhizus]|uniref:Uncharacterized protein n=2 Tax=Rhizopus TaxID=4842 RepID=A0A9P6YSS1_9FUNG|nr:hypothetical protein G6F52_011148 [Rhizopus delemar]KAG1561670.1 hypothetical protein G6F50_012179 [Rhizopus delemar]KAG1617234.1 hypothetical protein G6F45_012154 [Rhizopus arrhizus]
MTLCLRDARHSSRLHIIIYLPNCHNLEIIDGQEHQIQYIPVSDSYMNGRRDSQNSSYMWTMNQPQLSTMDVGRKFENTQYHSSHNTQHHNNGLPQQNNQSDILNLIQQTIRNELNTQQSTGRSYNKTYRSNNNGNYSNGNYKGNFNYHNNGNYNSGNYNNGHGERTHRLNISTIHQETENNGQSNTQYNQKSINQQQQHLNAILTQSEDRHSRQKDLYAAIRPERPPEVTPGIPYTKGRLATQDKQKKPAVTTRRITTKKHLEEIRPENSSVNDTAVRMETDLPMEKVQTKTPRKNPRREPPVISYDIVKDVLDQPANISVRDLITTTPRLRKDLIGACRPKRKSPNKKGPQETMALIEDEDINTTAAYTKIIIGNQRIKTLVDCGAAKLVFQNLWQML